MRRHRLYRIPALISLIASFWCVDSLAFAVNIDQFSVVRNGSILFDDGFSDGAPPPSGPNGNATYAVVWGTIPGTAESGARLQLDTANGSVTANAIEQARLEVRTRLLTNIDPNNLGAGLKVDDTLALTGIFSLTAPTGVFNPQYSIAFNDTSGGTGAHQILQLQVRLYTATGQSEIRYILQDFDANTITVLGSTPFAPPQGADEILLAITRPDVSNDYFYGSFAYLSGGTEVGSGAFSTPGLGFQGENFVRADFNISDGFVPEPATLPLIGLSFAVLGFSRRKRA